MCHKLDLEKVHHLVKYTFRLEMPCLSFHTTSEHQNTYFLNSYFALKTQSSFVKYLLTTGLPVGGRRLN